MQQALEVSFATWSLCQPGAVHADGEADKQVQLNEHLPMADHGNRQVGSFDDACRRAGRVKFAKIKAYVAFIKSVESDTAAVCPLVVWIIA